MKTTTTILLTFAITAIEQHAQIIVVPGTSDPWLAGMPDGTTASIVDVAPDQSPVLVLGIPISSGLAYSFTASGGVGNQPSHTLFGPEGNAGHVLAHATGAENGIATLTAPINALIGVFLGPSQPNFGVAPAGLDFSSDSSRDYLKLYPLLQQPFFIGDGLTSQGVAQQVIAPNGATRLYLGTMDGYEWSNNVGAFTVTVAVVPEPPSAAVFALFASLVVITRRLTRQG